MPDNQTEWKVIGNETLSPNRPVRLEWNNKEGLTFIKEFSIDNKYLITVNEQIKINQIKQLTCFIMLKLQESKNQKYKIFIFSMKGYLVL